MKKLVCVVHGVGEQSPGETVGNLVAGLTGNGALRVDTSVRTLSENTPTPERQARLYPCHIHRVPFADGETVFAEAYWADLSRGSSGRLATLVELLKVILGLGYIVRANAAEFYDQDHWQRRAARLTVWLLHGPIAVITLLLALALPVIFIAARLLPPPASVHVGIILTGLLAAAFAALKTGHLWSGRMQHKGGDLMELFFRTLMIIGAALVPLALLVWATEPSFALVLVSPGECASTNDQLCASRWYSFALLQVMGGCWIVLYAALTALVIQRRGENPPGLGDNPPYPMFPATAAAMTLLWLVVICTLWLALFNTASDVFAGIGIREEDLSRAIDVMALAWALFLALIFVAIWVWMQRSKAARNLDPDRDSGIELPRLILNGSIQRTLAVTALILTGYAVFRLLMVLSEHEWLGHKTNWLWTVAGTLPLVAIGAYSFFWRQLGVGLGVAKDIITYFATLTSAEGEVRYPVRDRIHDRFTTVLKTMLRSEKPDELVVVCHSQGTVIVVEALRDALGNAHPFLDTLPKASLITMGSPVDHIYRHYFAGAFPSPEGFGTVLDHWTNIYRLDDFIGTTIQGPDPAWPRNHAVQIGGHTGYWTDAEVRGILVRDAFPEFRDRA